MKGTQMNTPESLKPHEGKYRPDAWKEWSMDDLMMWTDLLYRRAKMRSDTPEGMAAAAKDRADALAYTDMIRAKLEEWD